MNYGKLSTRFFGPLFHTLLAALFPDHCFGCGADGKIICDSCLLSAAKNPPHTADWITTLFPYRDPCIQKAIWGLKYEGKTGSADICAPFLYERILETVSEEGLWFPGSRLPWRIVPIPISLARRKKRGYNQAEKIAEAFMKEDRGDLFEYRPDILVKTRETESQVVTKTRTERLKNIRGSFSVRNHSRDKRQCYIIIDDVTTTGSTLEEARTVLLAAGAECVLGLTLAA